MPFQVTMRRFGRKLDVERMRGELPMRAFFFDCLRLRRRDARRPPRARTLRRARAARCRRRCASRGSSPLTRTQRSAFYDDGASRPATKA